jgi:hypothetical protein
MIARRVVAGVNEEGKSVFLSDGPVPCSLDYQYLPGQAHARIWRTESSGTTKPPADEPTTDTGPMLPLPGGASFLLLQIAPASSFTDPRFDPGKFAEEFATHAPDLAVLFEPDNPGVHRTPTVDYVIVLDGEVVLELDDGAQTALTRGDTVVQLGTRHAWRNSTDRPATLAVVLTGAAG